jgi:signal transduction histidine kinase
MIRNAFRKETYQVSLIKSPLLLLLLMSLSIFLVDILVMTITDTMPLSSPQKKAYADAFILILFLSPMLFYFLFLPLLTHIQRRRLAEEALRVSDEQLRFLSSHLLVAQETERKRISVELHDDLGQALTFLKLRLRFIQNRLSDDQVLLKKECGENLQFIDQVIENIRRLSRDLSPSILDDLGLTASLGRLIEDFTKYYHAMETAVTMPNIDRFFAKGDQIFIYRIFQEALTNISKHSQARHVSVMVGKQDEDRVQFSIEDDGRGFDTQKVMAQGSGNRGMGLAALHQRVRTMGGSYSIITREGKGTKIVFTLPMEKRGE